MIKGMLRASLKKRAFVLLPRIAYWRVRRTNYRTNAVINDLSIKKSSSIAYRSDGVYPTMFTAPPSHYGRMNAARQYDAKGIPCKSTLYNPVSVIQYGLSEYGYYYTTGKQESLEKATAVCDWLVQNQDEETGYWYYRFDFHHTNIGYTLSAPWASAMAQGEGVSLLTRVYSVTKRQEYLDSARRALNMLEVPIADGGLCAIFDGYKIYEEYPTTPPSFTLNGALFCSFGLYDYATLTGDKGVQKKWESQVESIEHLLPLYDEDICSCYDLSHYTARINTKHQSEKYHILHIALLQNLQSIAPHSIFEIYIKKWAAITGIMI